MSNFFATNLASSNKAIRENRAILIAKDAEDSQVDLTRSLEQKEREIQRTIMDLEDLSPNSAMSLKPARDGFDPKAWVDAMQTNQVLLVEIQDQLAIARATFEKYFKPIE